MAELLRLPGFFALVGSFIIALWPHTLKAPSVILPMRRTRATRLYPYIDWLVVLAMVVGVYVGSARVSDYNQLFFVLASVMSFDALVSGVFCTITGWYPERTRGDVRYLSMNQAIGIIQVCLACIVLFLAARTIFG